MSHIRPRCFQLLCLVLLSLIPHAAAQTIDDLNQRWHDTFVALKNGQQDTADALSAPRYLSVATVKPAIVLPTEPG